MEAALMFISDEIPDCLRLALQNRTAKGSELLLCLLKTQQKGKTCCISQSCVP